MKRPLPYLSASALAAALFLLPACANDRASQRESTPASEEAGTGGSGIDTPYDGIPDDRDDAATVPEGHSGMLDPEANPEQRPFGEPEPEPATGGAGEDPGLPPQSAPTMDPAPATEPEVSEEIPAGNHDAEEDRIGSGTELLEPNEPGTEEQGQVNDDPLR